MLWFGSITQLQIMEYIDSDFTIKSDSFNEIIKSRPDPTNENLG